MWEGFNWATSFQTWKSIASSLIEVIVLLVSIGPRPFRHGNGGATYNLTFSSPGVSIGPRPFRHGNTVKNYRKPPTVIEVSIGPRPFRHGNIAT